MVTIKEMPYSEKYSILQDNMRLDQALILPLVRQHLGDEGVVELERIWREGAKPIPIDASDEEKYEIAYENWIWIAKNTYSFVREKMGEEGIERFERSEIEALKRQNAGPALWLLALVRAFSPGLAFSMTAKQMAYQLQWITPFSVKELSRERGVIDIPRCKILDFTGTEDLCLIGCQSTYPKWFAEQFKVRMEFDRQGNSCTCALAPL